jgi:pantetheine-phosphate adenylyltransferase
MSKSSGGPRKAVYAGSFDPVTNGHMYMIREGARLFDELVVAIGINPDKRYTFNLEQRMKFLEQSTHGIGKIRLDHFSNLFLVDYAQKIGADYILRGIRNPNDYEYERAMRYINSDINPRLTTVFLVPPREISEVSSSFVKALVGPAGWERMVKDYLPSPIYRNFLKHFREHRESGGSSGGLRDMTERG